MSLRPPSTIVDKRDNLTPFLNERPVVRHGLLDLSAYDDYLHGRLVDACLVTMDLTTQSNIECRMRAALDSTQGAARAFRALMTDASPEVRALMTDLLVMIDLLVDGEPVPQLLARMPGKDDHRGNLAAGAKGVSRALSDRDRWLAGRIGPAMRERGMLFVGLDVIGGFVTEINVTSPTGIRELEAANGLDIAGSLIDAVLRRLPGS